MYIIIFCVSPQKYIHSYKHTIHVLSNTRWTPAPVSLTQGIFLCSFLKWPSIVDNWHYFCIRLIIITSAVILKPQFTPLSEAVTFLLLHYIRAQHALNSFRKMSNNCRQIFTCSENYPSFCRVIQGLINGSQNNHWMWHSI